MKGIDCCFLAQMGPQGPKMCDLASLEMDKIDLCGGMGIGLN